MYMYSPVSDSGVGGVALSSSVHSPSPPTNPTGLTTSGGVVAAAGGPLLWNTLALGLSPTPPDAAGFELTWKHHTHTHTVKMSECHTKNPILQVSVVFQLDSRLATERQEPPIIFEHTYTLPIMLHGYVTFRNVTVLYPFTFREVSKSLALPWKSFNILKTYEDCVLPF